MVQAHFRTQNISLGKAAALSTALIGAFVGLTTVDVSDARASGNHASLQAATATTPTVSELLNASNTEYLIGKPAPVGMKPFRIFGIPLTYTNTADGVSASVWITAENQVVIAYQGTSGGENLLVDPGILITQIIDDFDAATVANPPAYTDALNFANYVVGAANAQGYSTSNIFLTGHSLGGIEAEYVASQTGMGGIAFESTGLPVKDIKTQGTNFVNTVEYGDPVSSYASDVSGEQPFCPPYTPGSAGGGPDPHYGLIIEFGSPADQATMTKAMANWQKSKSDDTATLAYWVGLLVAHHIPGVQAHDLGVTLNPYSALVDGIGVKTAPVWNVANLTIPQFIQAASAKGLLVTP